MLHLPLGQIGFLQITWDDAQVVRVDVSGNTLSLAFAGFPIESEMDRTGLSGSAL